MWFNYYLLRNEIHENNTHSYKFTIFFMFMVFNFKSGIWTYRNKMRKNGNNWYLFMVFYLCACNSWEEKFTFYSKESNDSIGLQSLNIIVIVAVMYVCVFVRFTCKNMANWKFWMQQKREHDLNDWRARTHTPLYNCTDANFINQTFTSYSAITLWFKRFRSFSQMFNGYFWWKDNFWID